MQQIQVFFLDRDHHTTHHNLPVAWYRKPYSLHHYYHPGRGAALCGALLHDWSAYQGFLCKVETKASRGNAAEEWQSWHLWLRRGLGEQSATCSTCCRYAQYRYELCTAPTAWIWSKTEHHCSLNVLKAGVNLANLDQQSVTVFIIFARVCIVGVGYYLDFVINNESSIR